MNDNVLATQETPIRTVYDDVELASEALLKRWEEDAPEEPSTSAEQEATEQEPLEETEELFVQEDEVEDYPEPDEIETEDPENEAEPQEQDDDDTTAAEVEIDDDTIVEILVDGNTEQASLKDLKRLFGQEKALTRKSQEVATQRKQAEESIGKTDVVMQKLIEKAEARWKPFSEVDMLVASRSMDTDDFAQLRQDAQAAHDDLKFIQEEADNYYGELQQQRQQAMQEQAREAVKVLERDIPNWNNKLYDDIRHYAIGQGLPEQQVNNYVDPAVLTIIHKARLYDQAKKVTTTKKKRVSKAVLKSKKAPATQSDNQIKRTNQSRQKLRNSSDMDDVADALLVRWEE